MLPPQEITRTGHTRLDLTNWDVRASRPRLLAALHSPRHAVTLQASGTTGPSAHRVGAGFSPDHHRRALPHRRQAGDLTASPRRRRRAPRSRTRRRHRGADARLDGAAFSARAAGRSAVCFHQDRLVIGGSRDLPNRLWLSQLRRPVQLRPRHRPRRPGDRVPAGLRPGERHPRRLLRQTPAGFHLRRRVDGHPALR